MYCTLNQTPPRSIEKEPMKIVQDQVPLKIHSKSGAFENIIMEILLLASFTKNQKRYIFSGTSIIKLSVALEIP